MAHFLPYITFFLQPQHFSNLLCSFPSFRPSGKDTCTCSRARHGKTHCPHIGPHTCPAMPCVLPILSLVFRVVPPSVAEGSNKKRGSERKKPSSAGQRNNKEKHSARSKEKRTQSNKKRTGERRFFLLSLSFCRCIVDFAIILKDSSGEETRGGFFGRPVADCNYQLLSNHKFHVASLIHTDQSCTEQRYCKVGSSEIRAAKGADGPMVLLYSSVDVNPVKVQMNAEERANRANMQ